MYVRGGGREESVAEKSCDVKKGLCIRLMVTVCTFVMMKVCTHTWRLSLPIPYTKIPHTMVFVVRKHELSRTQKKKKELTKKE